MKKECEVCDFCIQEKKEVLAVSQCPVCQSMCCNLHSTEIAIFIMPSCMNVTIERNDIHGKLLVCCNCNQALNESAKDGPDITSYPVPKEQTNPNQTMIHMLGLLADCINVIISPKKPSKED